MSPRKYSDRSDKQSASPTEVNNADSRTPKQAGLGQASGGTQLASLKPKREQPATTRHANMPPKIEEGHEPPHATVLPA